MALARLQRIVALARAWLGGRAERLRLAAATRPAAQERLRGVLLNGVVSTLGGGAILASSQALATAPISEKLRQQLLINALGVAVCLTDREGRVLLYNDAAVALWGRRPKVGSVRFCGAWKLFTAEGHPLPIDESPMAATVQHRRPQHGKDLILERPDGSRVPIIPYPTPLFDDDGGFLGAVNVLVDITERKDEERRRLILTREVDHRAKNLLAVVQSLVRLTKSKPQPQYSAALEGRLTALAHAHGLLAESGWEAASLKDVVNREMASYAGRVRLGGPPLLLAPLAVQPVAMLLHELASNAAQHGALLDPDGLITLTWGYGEEGGLEVAWLESGGPAVAEPARPGFGLRMMDGLANQLGGALKREWPTAGLRCTLTIPAARQAVAEPPPTPQRATLED